MLYIFTKVSWNRLIKARQMKFFGSLLQPALPQLWILPSVFLTNANALTLEQICNDLGISEAELNSSLFHFPTHFQAYVLQTPELRLRKAAVCPPKNADKSTIKLIKPILRRINALRLPNGSYQKLQPIVQPLRSLIACLSLTMSSTWVTVTYTSALDATLTRPTIRSLSKTFSLSNLASLIYFFLFLIN